MTGKQLQLFRVYLGLSQGEIAKEVGVSKFTVLNWEREKTTPQPDKIKQIEQKFNIQLDTIELKFEPCYNE